MVVLRKKRQFPNGGGTNPLTWYPSAFRQKANPHSLFIDDIAVITCSNGHQTRLTKKVHSVAPNGNVSPSYICTVKDDGRPCDFHAFVTQPTRNERAFNSIDGE